MSDEQTRMMPPNNPGGQTETLDRTMVATGATQMPGGMGATQMMPTVGVSDPYRTQMGGTTTCPVCKASTPLTETYCGECGFLLASAPTANVEIPLEEAPAAELIAEADGQRHKLRQGVNTVGRQGTDVLVTDGTLSRAHARITIEGNQITVEDLGSTNGTKVGDRRIGPNQPTPAPPGTTLRFGNWRALLQLGGLPDNTSKTNTAGSPGAAPTLMGGNQTAVFTTPMGLPTLMGGEASDKTLVGASGITPATSGVPTPGDLNPNDVPPAAAQSGVVVPPAINDGSIVARLSPTTGPGTEITVTEGTLSVGRRPGNTYVITNDAYISGRHAQIETDSTGTYLTDVGSTNGTSVNGQKLAPGERQLLLEGDEVQLGQTKYVFALALDDDTPASVSIMPSDGPSGPATFGGIPDAPDGSPPGQEFGAINDPVYPPQVSIQQLYHAEDNEMPQ